MGRHGIDASGTATGADALEKYPSFDLLLLDLDLPDIDGLAVCRAVRSASDVPMIAFTARGTELDRVLCLQAGCDDCLVKPYGFRELLARIEAVMRRVGSGAPGPGGRRERISHGPLQIDCGSREVRLNGRMISMTRKEFDLLHLLASQPANVLSREQLMAKIWNYQGCRGGAGAPASRTIDTHVSSLRSKLGAAGWIITVRGVGFRLGCG